MASRRKFHGSRVKSSGEIFFHSFFFRASASRHSSVISALAHCELREGGGRAKLGDRRLTKAAESNRSRLLFFRFHRRAPSTYYILLYSRHFYLLARRMHFYSARRALAGFDSAVAATSLKRSQIFYFHILRFFSSTVCTGVCRLRSRPLGESGDSPRGDVTTSTFYNDPIRPDSLERTRSICRVGLFSSCNGEQISCTQDASTYRALVVHSNVYACRRIDGLILRKKDVIYAALRFISEIRGLYLY